jgi:hypothetical protein
MLRGRGQQCGALDGLLVDVRAGRSRVLVVRGEPGIGKTALLDYAIQSASGFRVRGPPVLSRRWSSRSRPFTNCARPCWTGWSGHRARSTMRSAWRSG